MVKRKKKGLNAHKHLNLKGFLCLQIMHKLKKKPFYGDVLAMEIGKNKLGKLTPGTIYPALKHLKEKRLVCVTIDGRKKYYRLSKRGLEEYKLSKRLFKKMFKEMF